MNQIADGSGVVDVDGSGRKAGIECLACQGLVAGKGQRATVDQVERALAAQTIDTGARDDDVVEALGLVALDDHHVDIVVTRQQLARGHLVLLARVGVLRPARGADKAHVLGSGLVMAPGVLSGYIDVKAVMPMMLERTHAQAAAGELGNDLLDERGLARVLVADKRDRGDGRCRSCGRDGGRRACGSVTVGAGGLNSSGLTLGTIPHARAATLLVQQANVDDLHATIDGLAHVIDREARGTRAGQGLHLNTRLARHARRDQHMKANLPVRARRRPALGHVLGRRPRRRDRLDIALTLGNEQRMAHGDDVTRTFDGHDARNACASEHVALFSAILQHHGLRLGVHKNRALGDGNAMGLGLVGHVNHAHLALGIHVRQLVAAGVAGGLGSSAGGRLYRRGPSGVAGSSRGFMGRHRGPASGLGGIGVPALGHMIILRFGT